MNGSFGKKIEKKLKSIREASKEVRSAESTRKNQVLLKAAQLLKERQEKILAANEKDLVGLRSDSGAKKGRSGSNPEIRGETSKNAFIDRLLLTPQRIELMVESLRQVAALPDPVNEQTENRTLENGLRMRRVRSPLGILFMIFESRPNVAIEAFSLAFKAGNVAILRGGKESRHTVTVLYDILHESLQGARFSPFCLWGITDPDRKIPLFLLSQKKYIDVVVPRGGDGLINFVTENSKIPIIKNDRGLCHVYVHDDADLKMAAEIVVNAKTQRPGVCNSMETLLVHKSVAAAFLKMVYEATAKFKLKWFVDDASRKILKGHDGIVKARPVNWDTEYLDYKMNCKVVGSLEEAMTHIEEHGSRHSEAIMTSSLEVARRFQAEVDAAAVYWNASTRFTDGFEMGLGGELGISTQKLHVRGPVGLKELTSLRWVVDGAGQIR